MPTRATDPLDRYKRVLAPPTDEWPVLPTFHAPTLSRRARDHLGDDVVDDALNDGQGIWHIVRDHELVPPAITKNAARGIMKRLCEAAGLEVDSYVNCPAHGGAGLVSELGLYRLWLVGRDKSPIRRHCS